MKNCKCKIRNSVVFFFVLINIFLGDSVNANQWKKLAPGIDHCSFILDTLNKKKIDVIKVNPQKVSIQLLTRSESRGERKTAIQWVKDNTIICAFNSGMFLTDYSTNVGFCKNFTHFNNKKVNSKYKSFTVFNRKDNSVPLFQIMDQEQFTPQFINKKYHTVIQNLRLIKKHRDNRWKPDYKRWSEIALGEDKKGNMLVLLSSYPFTMYEFNEKILSLPIDIVAAQHLEGGPKASFYLQYKNTKFSWSGLYEYGSQNDDSRYFRKIPNVIGLSVKE